MGAATFKRGCLILFPFRGGDTDYFSDIRKIIGFFSAVMGPGYYLFVLYSLHTNRLKIPRMCIYTHITLLFLKSCVRGSPIFSIKTRTPNVID